METFIKLMIPSIDGHDTLLILVSALMFMFFGGILFSFIRSLFDGFTRFR